TCALPISIPMALDFGWISPARPSSPTPAVLCSDEEIDQARALDGPMQSIDDAYSEGACHGVVEADHATDEKAMGFHIDPLGQVGGHVACVDAEIGDPLDDVDFVCCAQRRGEHAVAFAGARDHLDGMTGSGQIQL